MPSVRTKIPSLTGRGRTGARCPMFASGPTSFCQHLLSRARHVDPCSIFWMTSPTVPSLPCNTCRCHDRLYSPLQLLQFSSMHPCCHASPADLIHPVPFKSQNPLPESEHVPRKAPTGERPSKNGDVSSLCSTNWPQLWSSIDADLFAPKYARVCVGNCLTSLCSLCLPASPPTPNPRFQGIFATLSICRRFQECARSAISHGEPETSRPRWGTARSRHPATSTPWRSLRRPARPVPTRRPRRRASRATLLRTDVGLPLHTIDILRVPQAYTRRGRESRQLRS